MGFFSDLFSWFRRRPPIRPPVPPPEPPDPPPKPPPDANETNLRLLRLHNAERVKAGLPWLILSETIVARAQHAAQVQADRGRVGHFTSLSPDFAENSAGGQRTEEEAMQSWMSSSGHRRNILGPYKLCGFGRVGDFWAARFA